MYPYIHLGSFQLGTFGLLLWLAAVVGTVVLHYNFVRNGVITDALNVVAVVTLSGIIGAKVWHELQSPSELAASMRMIFAPGLGHFGAVVLNFFHWFQAGFAWYGGLLAGIAALMITGAQARPNGLRGGRAMVRMLDLAAPAAAIGYGVGRIGCLTSGDGDYGKVTTLPWGVHMRPDALVPTPFAVQPTPVYEFLFAVVLAWWLWKRQEKAQPLGFITGEYLVLSGIARFLVEFVRINPHVYGPFTNAQVAAAITVVFGGAMMWLAQRRQVAVMRPLAPSEARAVQARAQSVADKQIPAARG